MEIDLKTALMRRVPESVRLAPDSLLNLDGPEAVAHIEALEASLKATAEAAATHLKGKLEAEADKARLSKLLRKAGLFIGEQERTAAGEKLFRKILDEVPDLLVAQANREYEA